MGFLSMSCRRNGNPDPLNIPYQPAPLGTHPQGRPRLPFQQSPCGHQRKWPWMMVEQKENKWCVSGTSCSSSSGLHCPHHQSNIAVYDCKRHGCKPRSHPWARHSPLSKEFLMSLTSTWEPGTRKMPCCWRPAER